ncbi:HupE/UreJ family protein [Mesorhizobium sp. ArgA1]
MNMLKKTFGLGVAAAIVATPALAHTGAGHADGFAAGFTHPLLGADYLLAMLSVGVWSALAVPAKAWIAPFAFVSAMLCGALLSFAGVGLPTVEGMIASSVLVLGLMVVAGGYLTIISGVALCSLFALFHGHAHASEATGAVISYIAGFSAATALIHVAGIGVGMAIAKRPFARLAVGGAVMAAGAFILSGI